METVCPNGHRIDVSPSQVGTEMRCPTCHQHFVVSSASGSVGNTPGGGSTTGGSTTTYTTGERNHRDESYGNRGGRTSANRGGDWFRYGDWDLDLIERWRPLGELLILLGLLLVITARGCDAIGQRYVTAAEARVEHEQNEFEREWQDRFNDLNTEEDTIRSREEPSAEDEDRLREINRERSRLRARQEDARRDIQRDLQKLRNDANEASTQRRLSEPWIDGAIMIGTLLLASGLLIVGLSPDSPGRWLCIILLAIIVASLFMAGNAWQDMLTPPRNE